MSTDIKPGQIWQWNSALPREGGIVVTKIESGNVHFRYEDESIKGEHYRDAEHFAERAHLVTDTAPLDPAWTLTAHQPAPEPEPEWEPGTVAIIECNGAAPPGPRRAVRRGGVWHSLDKQGYAIDANVTDVRPLVVIDPEDLPTDRLDELRSLALKQAAGHERMVELDGGIGLLGVREPQMFEGMEAWSRTTVNDHADTVLGLLDLVRDLTSGGAR